MKIQIGILALSSTWDNVLHQEGIPFTTIDPSAPLSEQCSILVVDRPLTLAQVTIVEEYLRSGGGVFGYAEYLSGVGGTRTHTERVDYLVSEPDEGRNIDIHVLDLTSGGAVPQEANLLRTQSNTSAMYAGPLCGGVAVLVPFDVSAALSDIRSITKQFYAKQERLPAERVSRTTKGEVRQLIHRAFEYLHHARNLPYAHLWYFPQRKRNLFAFRVDTDGAPKTDIESLYDAARDFEIGMSWYLDVKSHEKWLSHFCHMAGQEFGVHCYEHQTYPRYDQNVENISKAKRIMAAAGLPAFGFASPYGMWNRELARAVDELGFEYSSEFSYAYDTFPLYPETDTMRFATIQVPIHPISIGNLLKVGYTETDVKEYYAMVIDQKLARNEPLFFYHHPTHRCWDVVRFMFDYVQQKGIGNTTFADYSRWWKRRLATSFEISFDRDIMSLRLIGRVEVSTADDVWLRVSNPTGRHAITPLLSEISLNSMAWTETGRPCWPPADIRRIREFSPRTLLGEVYDTMMRKLR